MKELQIAARVENLDAVLTLVETELGDCPPKIAMQIALAVEEIFVNIARHAYTPAVGSAVIRVSVGTYAEIEFEDSGMPYNPLEKADPDVTAPAEARDIGGLGVFMVKNLMDSIEYCRTGDKNKLRIKKRIA